MGAAFGTQAMAGTHVKNKYHKSQSNKANTKASASATNGNNSASNSRSGGAGGRCLSVGSGSATCSGGSVTGGGPQTAVAGNINVQVPIAATVQDNTANDSNTGQAGGVS